MRDTSMSVISNNQACSKRAIRRKIIAQQRNRSRDTPAKRAMVSTRHVRAKCRKSIIAHVVALQGKTFRGMLLPDHNESEEEPADSMLAVRFVEHDATHTGGGDTGESLPEIGMLPLSHGRCRFLPTALAHFSQWGRFSSCGRGGAQARRLTLI